MASPPEIRVESLPSTCLTRAAAPRAFTALFSLASFAPVTVLSAETTTWFVFGSTAQAVPGILAVRSSVVVAAASWAPERATRLATAPAAVTVLAAASSVTVTTSLPSAPTYEPAVREPSLPVSVVASAAESGAAASTCARSASFADATAGTTSAAPAARPATPAISTARRGRDVVLLTGSSIQELRTHLGWRVQDGRGGRPPAGRLAAPRNRGRPADRGSFVPKRILSTADEAPQLFGR